VKGKRGLATPLGNRVNLDPQGGEKLARTQTKYRNKETGFIKARPGQANAKSSKISCSRDSGSFVSHAIERAQASKEDEIERIEREAWASWLASGQAKPCPRCEGLFIAKDPEQAYCSTCLPVKHLRFKDRRPQYPRCVVCDNPMRGVRSDTLYCGKTCKVMAYRKRRRAKENDNGSDIEDGPKGIQGDENET
jgi:hypothetical protein